MTTAPATLVLNAEQIHQKIRRIAFQIYENNFDETALLLAGISGEGYVLAQALAAELSTIAPFSVKLIQLALDKAQTAQPIVQPVDSTTESTAAESTAAESTGDESLRANFTAAEFTDKVIIVVDDVLYTGRTLAFSLQPFLQVPVRKLQVAVLVDRNYPRYPVAADYKGYELSTTLTEHVEVVLSDEARKGVYLK